MLVGRMVGDQIQNDFQLAVVRRFEQRVEIFHRPEILHNRLIIGNIITVIVVRRTENRVQPDDINAQTFDIIELFRNPFQIAHAVAVRVFEGTRINLINDRFLPPFSIRNFISDGGFGRRSVDESILIVGISRRLTRRR